MEERKVTKITINRKFGYELNYEVIRWFNDNGFNVECFENRKEAMKQYEKWDEESNEKYIWEDAMNWIKTNGHNNIEYDNVPEDSINDLEWTLIDKYFVCINIEEQNKVGDLGLKFKFKEGK